MYQYDHFDHTLVQERVAEFRGQVERHLNGELSAEQLMPLRLRNGLYKQRHAHMLRVAIPYGLLSSKQMHMLAYIARKYDRDYGHFTTRQNIQYNWPELKDAPDLLKDLASVEMHAIQTSGNCIRNTTTDQYAGVAVDELQDPRPYCEMIRQWSTLHPEFYWLPRKFKVAVIGAKNDRAAVLFHDIGLRVLKNEQDQLGLQVLVGGGMGRTPVIGKVIREFLPREHMLSYCEAILRVYNLYGNRDNKYRARIKILVKSLGIDEFRRQVDAEWEQIKDSDLLLKDEDFERMQSFFTGPDYVAPSTDAKNGIDRVAKWCALDTRFAQWYDNNTVEHKVEGYCIVVLSLKEPGAPPGDATADQMDHIADLAEQYSFGELRVTHDQNIIFADVAQADLLELWKKLNSQALATPNVGTLNDMICCPGLDFCSLANAGSIPIAKQINERFDSLDELYDIGELKIKMSGCVNACGHHHAGHIGILGVDKKGVECYQLTLGGSAEDDASIGERLGKAIAKEEVADAIDKLVSVYLQNRNKDERFLDTYRRIGIEPYQEKVYA